MKMSLNLKSFIKSAAFVAALLLPFTATLIYSGNRFLVTAQAQVCPEGDGWSQHQDPPFEEIEGATEYCFKAGPFLTDSIPEGGFGQEGACEEDHIERCELSHWSYLIPQTTPTPTPTESPTPTPTESPTPTPTPTESPTPTPTESPTPTPTPTESPTPTPTESPTPTPEESPTPTPEESPTPTPTESPTPSPTPTPTESPTPTPEESPTPTPEVLGEEDPGEVLGAETLAATGEANEALSMIGLILVAISLHGLYQSRQKRV